MSYNFVSLEDRRLNQEHISGREAVKFYAYHEVLFGPHKCYIEQDGVEIDPDELKPPEE